MKAYILINVHIGTISAVLRHLHSIQAVRSAEMTFGEYDIVVVVEVADVKALAATVSREIQTIPNIAHTVTCLAIDFAV